MGSTGDPPVPSGRWRWKLTLEKVRALFPFRAAGRRSASGLCYPSRRPLLSVQPEAQLAVSLCHYRCHCGRISLIGGHSGAFVMLVLFHVVAR